ncbi:unnamed protein product [marine sediment metagenome]|uniref:DUF1064 domain-containing protein n=1 Tax=marine sediment metagenome TaxID=412755 RepID=X1TMA3_9ZZZZ
MKPIHRPKTMNKTEALYAENLENKKKAGIIIDWKFEAMKFRLGDGANGTNRPAFFTPDFFVIHNNHFELIEVKGFFREAAKVRMKTARELYPWLAWTLVKVFKGGWQYEDF